MPTHARDRLVAAAEQLAGGGLGSPMIIKSLTHGPGLPPAWANDIRTSNGMLAEVNSHDLDTVCWFAGSEPVDIGVGGSIPFIADLVRDFPQAQILVTGVEDPHGRAHSPNESLHLDTFRHALLAEALLLETLDRRGSSE